ncbi:MAG: hypothetical protein NC935_08445 [Candidatus Omnitrophica bacterium]|nr:hypothetical protein [Candidatus Omnitrophota bacterium]
MKKKAGRPTKFSEEVVKKLESIFKIGGTVEQACAYANISKETYYNWIEENADFLTKMEAAKYYSDIAAKNIVTKAIIEDKDLETAKWWLEKREFKNPQPAVGVGVMVNIKNEFLKEAQEFQ